MTWAAILSLASSAFAADCPEQSSAADVTSALSAAEASYVTMDASGFASQLQRAHDLLPCLEDVLSKADVAALYRIDALEDYLAGDSEAARDHFASALGIQPYYKLSSALAVEGNPLQELYDEARTAVGGPTAVVTPPVGALLYVDGVRSDHRPAARAALLQMTAQNGAVLWTALTTLDEPLPDAEALGLPPAPPMMATGSSSNGLSTAQREPLEVDLPTAPFAIASGVLAVSTAVLLGTAMSAKSAYVDPDNPDVTTQADLDALKRRANTTSWASLGTGLAAAGLGATAVVTVAF